MLEELKQVFFEECHELLAALEDSLTEMGESGADPDVVGSAFRAIHSVKGGAGTFGLGSLIDFSHHFENALDLVRSGKLEATPEVMEVFLRANDVVVDLVQDAQAGVDNAGAERDEVLGKIKELTGGGKPAPKPAAAPAASGDDSEDLDALFEDDDGPTAAGDDAEDLDALFEGDDAAPAETAEDAGASTTLKILIQPATDFYRRAVDPAILFEGLGRLGDLTLEADASEVPELGSLDPAANYIRWNCTLVGEAKAATVENELDLFLDDTEYSVVEEAEAAPEEPEPEAALPDAPEPDAAAAAEAAPEPPRPAAGKAKGGSRPVATTPSTIRVNLDRIDRMVNMVGEIVITQAMLAERAEDLKGEGAAAILEGIHSLSRQSRELQESVMSVRAQPLKAIFSRMPRLARELAGSLGKKVRLEIEGEHTEVDKTVIEELADPLTHMLRNAMDHGIESPEARAAAGKPAEGSIKLMAEHRGGKIRITLKDDGAGVNRERVLAKAVAAGLVEEGASLPDDEIDNLIFHPGLSTADKVSDVSGRGVGMDVVKRNIQGIGGRISLKSDPGVGSEFRLTLPLTLAVLEGMVVRVGEERFVLPIASIVQSMRLPANMLNDAPGLGVTFNYRGDFLPLYDLSLLLDVAREPSPDGGHTTVIVENETGQKIGLAVDEIVGQQQVVIKSMEKSFRPIQGISAATILGNGLVALIVDIDALPDLARMERPAFDSLERGAA